MAIVRAEILHRALLGCCGVLLLLFLIPVFAIGGSIGLLLMQTVPMLVVLPGLIRNKPRNLQWLGFLVLFYLLNAILQIFSHLMLIRTIGISSALLCILLFTAVIVSLKKQPHHPAKDH
jgi:uncharacterized membrane protein